MTLANFEKMSDKVEKIPNLALVQTQFLLQQTSQRNKKDLQDELLRGVLADGTTST